MIVTKEGLTVRETEVLHHAMRGHTATESAVLLFLSPKTVKTIRVTILRKLGARNMPHAVALYLDGVP